MSNLVIRPIQLPLHQDVCVAFRADSFVASFGDAGMFHGEDGRGAQRYLQWLTGKSAQEPRSVAHVWRGEEIIGQIELGTLRTDPTCGYVNLYYLIPAERGQGTGKLLDDYAADYFASLGLPRAQLSVSPQNARAIAFYEKRSWKNLGPRADDSSVLLMEKSL